MRYFLFAYIWEGITKNGNGTLRVESETFPSNESLKIAASKMIDEKSTIVIKTWNEFKNKQDYDDFLGK